MARTGSSFTVFWLAAVALNLSAGCGTHGDGTVSLRPGQDLLAIVASSPEGTRFHLSPGIYRQQTIYPRNRQEFVGQEGVILSGAMELETWRREGGFWVAEDLPPPLGSHGSCKEGRELCAFPEDLFINDQVHHRVG
jgi:hypothetical protein